MEDILVTDLLLLDKSAQCILRGWNQARTCAWWAVQQVATSVR
jgi:hypothetical protein